MTTVLPRGIRNNNPGNIEYNGTPWHGLDTAEPSDGRFCRFIGATWGIRALAKVLITYQNVHGLNTVRGMIDRWAPPHENDTGAYVAHVAQQVGVEPDAPIDIHDCGIASKLVTAIIQHENGTQPYNDDVIENGLALAGIKP